VKSILLILNRQTQSITINFHPKFLFFLITSNQNHHFHIMSISSHIICTYSHTISCILPFHFISCHIHSIAIKSDPVASQNHNLANTKLKHSNKTPTSSSMMTLTSPHPDFVHMRLTSSHHKEITMNPTTPATPLVMTASGSLTSVMNTKLSQPLSSPSGGKSRSLGWYFAAVLGQPQG